MSRKRKGMVIKNTNDKAVQLTLSTRTFRVGPGEEAIITAEEVRDPVLRENLQVRAVSIVRPSTEEEEAELQRRLAESESAE